MKLITRQAFSTVQDLIAALKEIQNMHSVDGQCDMYVYSQDKQLGRVTVFEETLSDGSKVYNVEFL